MKKVGNKNAHFIWGDSLSLYDSEDMSLQKLYLVYLCGNTFPSFYLSYSQSVKNSLQRKFMLWQSRNSPSTSWISKNCFEFKNEIDGFSHDKDLSWNELSILIDKYVVLNTVGYGCETNQEHLKDIYFSNSESIFD